MTFAPGRTKTGGRKAGTPNRATHDARRAVSDFIESNMGKLQGWLEEIHKEEGALAAFKCVTDLLEYHVPKLSRAEIISDEPSPIFDNKIIIEHVSPEVATAAYKYAHELAKHRPKEENLPRNSAEAKQRYTDLLKEKTIVE